ncbi:hypothetical protein [Spongiactinospora sp. TRM90649]|uniref:hypothetical protein n=1 Tax=Spongiactinospora sp. TRM90649 TaxID=3031114 RepID=UPI0023F6269D|nr:hypothetical protein [Spongiactinospora sp. TRM90649]MDF5758059.1 hypothetical protein [Spongiactinospora sp. TRM90649]
MSFPRRLLARAALLLSALLSTTALSAQVPAAAAGPVVVDCRGSVLALFSPALRSQPGTITVAGDGYLSSCVTTDPVLRTGRFEFSGTGVLSCALGATLPVTGRVVWRDGAGQEAGVSQISAPATPPPAPSYGSLVLAGTLADGPLPGTTCPSGSRWTARRASGARPPPGSG